MTALSHPIFVLLVLCAIIALSEWLAQKPWFRSLGAALLVILIAAVVANLGVIPSASNPSELYPVIFKYVAPLAIFYLLLEVNLKQLKGAGVPMLAMFLLGSLGTVVGVIIANQIVDGPEKIGALHHAIAGMLTGTYTGGSINFNAVALHYEVNQEGNLYVGTVAIDNIITTLWMIASIGIPKILQQFFPRKVNTSTVKLSPESLARQDAETVSPMDLGIMISLGLLALWLSEFFTDLLTDLGVDIPSIVVLSTLSLILAQLPWVHRMRGSRLLGIFLVYLFLAVIGAYCEFSTLGQLGSLALTLLSFAGIMVIVHGLITYGGGALLKYDWNLVSIASQANIGGATTALALARSFNRDDLFLPAILVGSLGTALGTYLGFLVAGWLCIYKLYGFMKTLNLSI